MLALAQIRAESCDGCGGDLRETTAQDEWGRPVHQYEAEAPHRCYSCDVLQARQAALPETTPNPRALRWPRPRKKKPTT